jgi:hypothetical protein
MSDSAALMTTVNIPPDITHPRHGVAQTLEMRAKSKQMRQE